MAAAWFPPASDRRARVKILFVDSYPQEVAGQQRTLLAMLDRAAQEGFAPTVVLPQEGGFADHLRTSGWPVEVVAQPDRLGGYGGAVYRLGPLGYGQAGLSWLKYVRGITKWLRGRDETVMFCNDLRGVLTFGVAAQRAKKSVVLWDKLDKPHGLLDHVQLPLVTRNLVISRAVLEKYPAWQRRAFAGRIEVVPNGIDIARFSNPKKGNLRALLGLPENAVVAATIGTICARKGQDIALSAARAARQHIPNLHYVAIGPELAEEAAFAATCRSKAGPQDHFPGSQTDVASLLGDIDILLSPSRHEGMGRVNVEAMAAGIPVIGARGTGVAEVIAHQQTGLLVDQEDSAAIADGITSLAADSTLRHRMGEAAKARAAEHFNADRQLARVFDILREEARR